VVLDEVSQWSTGRRDEILVVGVGDVVRLGSGNFVFCNDQQGYNANIRKDIRGKWMFISSPSKSALYELLPISDAGLWTYQLA
jgi:hypothetical protein